MNWDRECKNLRPSKKFLKLKPGEHSLKFLNNGNMFEKTFKNGDQSEIKTQIDFDVEYKGERYVFTVTKSKIDSSLFGQLAYIGRFHSDLTGQIVSFLVVGEGTDTKYTLPQSIELMAAEKENNN